MRPAASLRLQRVRQSDALVELRDILPTRCELGGVPVPAGLDGRSMLPCCRGETPADWRGHLHGEHEAGFASNHWIVQGPWKYAWYSQTGTELLFNLPDDPGERRNLAATHPAESAALRQLLVESLRGREEGYVAGDRLVAGRQPQAVLHATGLA